MAKKDLLKRFNSLRAIPGFRYFYKLILGKFNFRKIINSSGFTLVEILVVVLILGILFAIAIVALDPIKQIGKVRDAQRQNDLKQISTALDVFYNDNIFYPTDIGVLDDASKYMQSVPSDPINKDTTNYLYIPDSSDSQPQWYVLFASLENKDSGKSMCPLEKIKPGDACLPLGIRDKNDDLIYNYCVVGGNIDCKYINAISL